jgi:hypothetical protein
MEYKAKKQPTQSQRLRATLYILWESKPAPKQEFEQYYRERMDDIIQTILDKIPK